jgi:hypothetical protein
LPTFTSTVWPFNAKCPLARHDTKYRLSCATANLKPRRILRRFQIKEKWKMNNRAEKTLNPTTKEPLEEALDQLAHDVAEKLGATLDELRSEYAERISDLCGRYSERVVENYARKLNLTQFGMAPLVNVSPELWDVIGVRQ